MFRYLATWKKILIISLVCVFVIFTIGYNLIFLYRPEKIPFVVSAIEKKGDYEESISFFSNGNKIIYTNSKLESEGVFYQADMKEKHLRQTFRVVVRNYFFFLRPNYTAGKIEKIYKNKCRRNPELEFDSTEYYVRVRYANIERKIGGPGASHVTGLMHIYDTIILISRIYAGDTDNLR